jgi:hypothetical protein
MDLKKNLNANILQDTFKVMILKYYVSYLFVQQVFYA